MKCSLVVDYNEMLMHTVVFKKQALAQMVSCFETQTHRETCIVKYNFSKLAKEQVPGRKPTTLV